VWTGAEVEYRMYDNHTNWKIECVNALCCLHTQWTFKTATADLCDFNENVFIVGLYIMQTHLPCCVYAKSSMEFQCFEVKPEADSPHDDKPSTGMFAVYDAALSALTSCCGSVVSCGSVIETPKLANSQFCGLETQVHSSSFCPSLSLGLKT